MKIKLTKNHKIFMMTLIMLFFFIVGLWLIVVFSKPKNKIPFQYDKSQTYEQNLQRWKSQCDFKPGVYTGEEIRNKLGKKNKIIYLLDDNIINPFENLDDKRTGSACVLKTNSKILCYIYHNGLFFDDWYFAIPTGPDINWWVSNNTGRTDVLCLGSTMSNKDHIKFNTYVDTTPPPNPADFGL